MLFTPRVSYYADFDQVQGLAPGSIVSLSGLTIGNVRAIEFNPDGNSLTIRLSIDSRFKYRITEGTQVDVRTQGALGDRYIFMNPGPLEAPALPPGSRLPQARSSGLFDVISERGNEIERVFEILDEVLKLTRTINSEGGLAETMGNLRETSYLMKGTMTETRHLISEVRSSTLPQIQDSSRYLHSILGKIDSGEGTLGALINDPALHDRLSEILGTDGRSRGLRGLLQRSLRDQN